MSRIFRYYYFDGFRVDVFGYDPQTDRYVYFVETPDTSKVREAKARYKYPDKRNEWLFPYGAYIYIITPARKKVRLWLD